MQADNRLDGRRPGNDVLPAAASVQPSSPNVPNLRDTDMAAATARRVSPRSLKAWGVF